VKELRTVKKVLTIDSRDRDPTKYVKVNGGASTSDPGDFVVYLPRVYENVVSVRLRSANIAAPQTTGFADDYILMSIEGLNKIDETATGAQRSGLVDNAFAKINNPNMADPTSSTQKTYTIVNVTLTGIDYGLKSGSGPQTAKVTFTTHSADGSTIPVSRAA
jgi:hypothetical protein